LPALCTSDAGKAEKALAQLTIPERFGAPYGPRFTLREQPGYDPDAYWRGPAWPQLNYLSVLAARRWGLTSLADELATATKRAVLRAGFSEYWNPETGRGLGAKPQTWAAVAAAL
jgi:glycogen debranching enzyme